MGARFSWRRANSIKLYSSNCYKPDLSPLGFEPKSQMSPCKDIEGFQARVRYAGSSGKTVDGQLIWIEVRN